MRKGWNEAPSIFFPGETTLACPKCGSTDITLSVRYPFQGSGPNGRGRLGDAGSNDTCTCNQCHYSTKEAN